MKLTDDSESFSLVRQKPREKLLIYPGNGRPIAECHRLCRVIITLINIEPAKKNTPLTLGETVGTPVFLSALANVMYS